MNAASQWRADLARHVAPLYAANPHVAAVLLGGSTARGHADRYSDIELGVFWHQPPSEPERRAIAAQIRGELIALYPHDPSEDVWCDDLMLHRQLGGSTRDSVLLEVVHYTAERMERTLDAVLVEADPDPLRQNLIAGVVQGLPLHQPELVHHWQARAAAYPDSLVHAVVNRHAPIDHFWRWEMWLARGGNLMQVYQSFALVQQKLLHVLLGLNRVYYFGLKWLDVVGQSLPLRPDDLVPRLNAVFRADPAHGANLLAALVEETYDLVERQLPAIDVAWLRSIFRHRRQPCDDAPG